MPAALERSIGRNTEIRALPAGRERADRQAKHAIRSRTFACLERKQLRENNCLRDCSPGSEPGSKIALSPIHTPRTGTRPKKSAARIAPAVLQTI